MRATENYSFPPANLFSINGDLVPEFFVGNPLDPDDFFMAGVKPFDENHDMGLVTCRILDITGQQSLTMLNSQIIETAESKPFRLQEDEHSLIVSSISKTDEEPLFSIYTNYDKERMCLVTHIEGTFYDKVGNVIIFGGKDTLRTRTRLWLSDRSKSNGDFSDVEREFIRLLLRKNNQVYKIKEGVFDSLEDPIDLDGALLVDAIFNNCKIVVRRGDWVAYGRVPQFENCSFLLPFGWPSELLNECQERERSFIDLIGEDLKLYEGHVWSRQSSVQKRVGVFERDHAGAAAILKKQFGEKCQFYLFSKEEPDLPR